MIGLGAAAWAAAFAAWLGTALLALAGGRRALAAALALAGLGLAGGELEGGRAGAAIIIGGGALVAAGLRLRAGPPGWDLAPPGSTPRLILTVVCLAGAGLAGGVLGRGADRPGLVGALAVVLLATASLLGGPGRAQALAAATVLALALGALGGPSAAVMAGIVAVALQVLPSGDPAARMRPGVGHE